MAGNERVAGEQWTNITPQIPKAKLISHDERFITKLGRPLNGGSC